MRIAILEDDPDQVRLVRHWLSQAEHSVECYSDAASFLRAIKRDSFDLYVLDWVLPDLSGIDVLEKLRGELNDSTPVVVATSKDEERNIVRALEAGADDYLVKPVRQGELAARVAAVLRRTTPGAAERSAEIEFLPYTFNATTKSAILNGEPVQLTNKEFDLALFLFQNAGKVVSRGHMLETIWGIENRSVSTRTIDTHVSRLRRKLALCADQGWVLAAIYQHGYRMERLGTAAPKQ